ncbi:hypothetical protein [Nocardia sp. NPDC050412]|uniref:hypothetical protein n=1 Tax=Nocardia sp. NPDC050412 TaxID=3364320 RepID=UPI0037A32D0C
MPGNAIGVINTSLTESALDDEQLIRDLAHKRGYILAQILTINADTYMPTALIVATAHRYHAVAMIAPNLRHFGPSPKAITHTYTLVIPNLAIPRTGGWTPNP